MALLGGLLVLATWFAVVLIVVSLGLVFIRPQGKWKTDDLLTSAWWGLGIVTLLGFLLAFFVPLRSTVTVVIVLATTAVLGIFGWRAAIRAGFAPLSWTTASIVFATALVLATGYFALAVLGPVTHYDAGLYQWAAVQYAGDHAVMPGLANLYGPLGYASAEPVLGALLGATAWQAEGFRLLGGLFMLLLGLEALTRMVSHPRQAGTAVALAGTALVAPPMIWMADFWVASPTPDLPVLVLAVVAAAYLADLVTGNRTANALPTVLVLAALMTALRPTAAALAGALVATAVAAAFIRKRPPKALPMVSSAVFAAALAAAVIARDRMLSGWLQYPLGIYAFDVPWRAPDPEELRTATLGFARDPVNWQEATTGWGWVGPWLARLPQQWELWWLLGALIAAVALLTPSTARTARFRALGAVLAPFVLAAALWWAISPPALRFGWGPLFGLTAICLGWALWRARWQAPAIVVAAAGIAVTVVVAGGIRLDWTSPTETQSWLGIPYEVVPLPTPSAEEFVTESGLVVRVPSDSDQCWSVYPLCTPDPLPSLTERGPGIDAGFVS